MSNQSDQNNDDSGPRCPQCGSDELMGQQYDWTERERYDGISEWWCCKCGTRWGRWTGKILGAGEAEPRYGVVR